MWMLVGDEISLLYILERNIKVLKNSPMYPAANFCFPTLVLL